MEGEKHKEKQEQEEGNKEEIVKKVKEEKMRHSLNKQLKVQWCSLIEKRLDGISCSGVSPSGELLVIGRESPSLEFYRIQEGRLILIHSNQLNRQEQITGVEWLDNEKVITCSLNGQVNVYSTTQLSPLLTLQVADCLWDMAIARLSLPQLILAADDGIVRIYQCISNPDDHSFSLQFLRQSRQQASKCVSLSLTPNNDIISLFSDGSIRKMTGADMRVTMCIKGVEGGQPVGRVVECLSGDEMAIGMSDGCLIIYEHNHGTQVQQFQHHIADILCICFRGENVYYSGSDSRIVELRRIKGEWRVGSEERGQSHDVKSVSLLSKNMLISAGLSTDICIYQLSPSGAFPPRHFEHNTTKRLRHSRNLYQPMITKSVQHKDSTLLLVNQGFSLQLFSINKQQEHHFILSVESNDSPIIAHDLSKQGNLIAYSTLEQTKVLLLSNKDNHWSVEKATLDQNDLPAAQLLSFGRSSDLLYWLSNSTLSSYDIITNSSTKLHQLPSHIIYTIIQQTKNEKFLAIGGRSASQDSLIVLDTDTNKIIYSLQKYLKNRVFKTFKIEGDKLFVLYDNSKFIVVDFIRNQVNKRTKQILNRFPKNYLQMDNKIEDILLHPFNSQKLVLVAVDYYVTVFLDHEINELSQVLQNREEVNASGPLYNRVNFDIVKRKQPIIAALTLDKSLIIFQSTWPSLLNNIQNPIFSKKYLK